MGCILVILIFFSSRVAILFWWAVDTARWDAAFTSAWIPIVGFFFLPMTTLMFVLVAPSGELKSIDWLWMGLALIGDLSHTGSSARARQEQAKTQPSTM